MPDFLLELGLEELPARMIASAQAELLKRTLTLLTREQLIDPAQLIPADQTAHAYSTPRRLAVLVRNVLTQQPDITEDTTGPAIKIAFKDGAPTPAAEAFARKAGIPVADLRTISTPKGDYLAATTIKKGRTAAEVIAAELPKEIAALYWAKNMRWIPGSNEKFVRPVLWLVCLLGEEIVPLTFAGRTAGRATYGHRVLSSGEPFEIQTPGSYLAQLEGEYVLADVELRRQKIRKALDKVTREVPNARWREDEALVDAVTHLTEWPDVLLGNFEPAYLTLPEEVLVTVMRDHQKYFAVESQNNPGAPHLDSEMWVSTNPLAPHFLTVTNIALTDENTPIIKQGNERVLRARFNDARFFWEFDQRTPLAARVALLENVTFQKDLGSYAAKTERVRELAGYLAGVVESWGTKVDNDALSTAITLAKTDLTTELVKEFTELQGVIGGLYAASQGVSKAACDAIYDQYIPASMEDGVPRSIEGALLGIADRGDTIAGMFGLGMEPTGSKDPFALRRAANGIVKILAESGLPLTLAPILNHSTDDKATREKMRAFFHERIGFYLREAKGQTYDVVAAVLAPMQSMPNYGDVADAVRRAEAITSMRGSEDFLAVCAAFKRMRNILEKAPDTEEQIRNGSFHGANPIQLERMVIKALKVRAESAEFIRRSDFVSVLQLLATLRPFIDDVFDNVKIIDENEGLRRFNLLKLLETKDCFAGIADFSEIVTAG